MRDAIRNCLSVDVNKTYYGISTRGIPFRKRRIDRQKKKKKKKKEENVLFD